MYSLGCVLFELIADLSRTATLRVIARTSSVAATQRTRDLREVARILDIRYLVDGSVRKAWKSYANLRQLDTANPHVAAGLIRAGLCAAVLTRVLAQVGREHRG